MEADYRVVNGQKRFCRSYDLEELFGLEVDFPVRFSQKI